MEETNLIIEGFKFMGLGMGTVLLFLVVMIVCMNIMSIVIHKFFPEPEPIIPGQAETKQDNKKVIAAITAAIAHHRQG
jgi:oxaloacetate decarboxylase gamma subunit